MRTGKGALAVLLVWGLVAGMVWVVLQPTSRTTQAPLESGIETWFRSL